MTRLRLLIVLVLLPLAAQAAPLSVDIDRDVRLAIGTRSFGPVLLPNDLTVCTFSITRNEWTDPVAVVAAQIEISVNGGVFQPWLALQSNGSGTSHWLPTSMKRQLPPGLNRQARGTYTVSGARFRSTVSVSCQ
jgi:hypothetical protein